MDPTSPEAYNDSYSYDYAAWNNNAHVSVGDGSSVAENIGYGEEPATMPPNMPGVSNPNPYMYPPQDTTTYSHDPEEAETSALLEGSPQGHCITEEELTEMCEGPLELDKPTPMEVTANQDPLFGRVYKIDKPIGERPREYQLFINGLASIMSSPER